MKRESTGVEVTFSIESRPCTAAQRAAGDRLFGRLLAKAQAEMARSESKSADKSDKTKASRREEAKEGEGRQAFGQPPSSASEDSPRPVVANTLRQDGNTSNNAVVRVGKEVGNAPALSTCPRSGCPRSPRRVSQGRKSGTLHSLTGGPQNTQTKLKGQKGGSGGK